MSPEKFLQYVELAEFDGDRLRLKKAALLLFAKNINKWHPRSRVRILRVNGTEEKPVPHYNVTEVADISGNIFRLLEESWEKLSPVLSETRYSEDGLFKTQVIYPEQACREALVNAITHRDYSIEGRGIEIRIFDDRLEILSPGKLLSKLTIKDLEELKGAHETRNTYVARVLREYGYIRELGEGVRRMFELMNKNELVPPKIESPNKSFIVTLFYKFIYTKEEKNWLDHFKNLHLSREQKTIIKLGLDGRLISPKEIFDHVGIVDTDYYRQIIESLKKIGILKTVVSTDEIQKMRLAKGVSRKSIPRFQIVIPSEKEQTNSRLSIPKQVKNLSDQTIYVAGIDWHTTEHDLEGIFLQFGRIEKITIPKNQFTGRTKGFAFIEFESTMSAKNALDFDSKLELTGRKLIIQKYKT